MHDADKCAEPMKPQHQPLLKSKVLYGSQAGLLSGLMIAGSLLLILNIQLTAPAMAQAQMAQAQIAQQNQQPPKRRTLFDMLFGDSDRRRQPETVQPRMQQPAQRKNVPVKKKPVISKPKPAAGPSVVTPAQPAQPEILPKNANAKTVLVIGDFIASGVADGLNETFAQMPDLQIVNRTNGSSGFVRQDYYSWSKELPAILAEQKPAVIVIMIGANDRQSLSQKSTNIAPDTAEWKTLYQTRIDGFLAVTAKSGIPVVWMGQPPYQSSVLTQTMLSLNAIYKSAAEKSGFMPDSTIPNASFVDVWDGFVDDKGAFTQTGVDVNGQTVRLRGNDGITITAAGKRKLAFYAEKPLRQILKLSSPEVPESTLDAKSNEPMAVPVHKEITRIGPMKLSDLDQSSDEILLGDTATAAKPAPIRTGNQLIPYGRADDFRWPRP